MHFEALPHHGIWCRPADMEENIIPGGVLSQRTCYNHCALTEFLWSRLQLYVSRVVPPKKPRLLGFCLRVILPRLRGLTLDIARMRKRALQKSIDKN